MIYFHFHIECGLRDREKAHADGEGRVAALIRRGLVYHGREFGLHPKGHPGALRVLGRAAT